MSANDTGASKSLIVYLSENMLKLLLLLMLVKL